MRKINSILCAIAILIFGIAETANALPNPNDRICKLGDECILGQEPLLVPVKKSLSATYQCHFVLRNREIYARLSSRASFIFWKIGFDLNPKNPQKTTLIKGAFTDEDGGYISIIAVGDGWATVRCTPA